jgi:hypothetical protein
MDHTVTIAGAATSAAARGFSPGAIEAGQRQFAAAMGLAHQVGLPPRLENASCGSRAGR